METRAKIFINPARQNQFIQENIFNKAPVRLSAIAMNTNSAFKDPTLKIHFDINILISDKLENTAVVSRLSTWTLHIIVAFMLGKRRQ